MGSPNARTHYSHSTFHRGMNFERFMKGLRLLKTCDSIPKYTWKIFRKFISFRKFSYDVRCIFSEVKLQKLHFRKFVEIWTRFSWQEGYIDFLNVCLRCRCSKKLHKTWSLKYIFQAFSRLQFQVKFFTIQLTTVLNQKSYRPNVVQFATFGLCILFETIGPTRFRLRTRQINNVCDL